MLLNAGRAITAFFMIGKVDSNLLFGLAFAVLVLGKGYAVAKASVVPVTARTETELVNRNSRLAVLSGVAGLAGGVPAWLISVMPAPTGSWVLRPPSSWARARSSSACRVPTWSAGPPLPVAPR